MLTVVADAERRTAWLLPASHDILSRGYDCDNRNGGNNKSFTCFGQTKLRLPLKVVKIKMNRIITTQPVVLYGCESWSLALREERRRRLRPVLSSEVKEDEIG